MSVSAIALFLTIPLRILCAASLPQWDWNTPVLPVRATDPPLEDWQRRTALFIYFSPECSHCTDSWPQVVEMARRAQASGLRVGGIATYATSRADIEMFLEALGEDVPVWFDSSHAVASTYGIKSVPKAILVEPNGEVQLFGDLTPRRLGRVEAIAKRAARVNQ